MSKTWYPKIDKEKCIEYEACINRCNNSVYDKTSNIPIVLNPDNCCKGCHGCANICPVNAISYFGEENKDNTKELLKN